MLERFGFSLDGTSGFRNRVSGPRWEQRREPGGALSQGARGRKAISKDVAQLVAGWRFQRASSAPRLQGPPKGASGGRVGSPLSSHTQVPGPPRTLWTHSRGCGRPDCPQKHASPLSCQANKAAGDLTDLKKKKIF